MHFRIEFNLTGVRKQKEIISMLAPHHVAKFLGSETVITGTK